MSRKVRVVIRTDVIGSDCEDFIEVSDNISDEQLERECYQTAMSMAEWWYEDVEE